MFWNKPKKEVVPAVVPTAINTPSNYVRNSDILVIRKVDEIDLEFIRRNEPMIYTRMMVNGADDIYYIVRDSSSKDWRLINQHTLDNEYTKVGE